MDSLYKLYKRDYLAGGGADIFTHVEVHVTRPPERISSFDDKYVGKVVRNELLWLDEIRHASSVRKVDPEGEWSVPFEAAGPIDGDTEFRYQIIYKYGGDSLDDIIYESRKNDSKIRPENVILFTEIIPKAMTALDKMHSRGFTHGDVTLKNLVYNEADKTVRLIDFQTLEPAVERGIQNDWAFLYYEVGAVFYKHVEEQRREDLLKRISHLPHREKIQEMLKGLKGEESS